MNTADTLMMITWWSGVQSQRHEGGFEVIRDQQAWRRVWRSVGEEPPEADFTEHVGIAAWRGRQPVSGSRIGVSAVRLAEGRYEAVIERQKPEPGDLVAAGRSAPWFIALVPYTDKPIEPVVSAGR